MAHSLVVTDTVFQHKAAHLQTWVNPKATDTTKHQVDHTIVRRLDVKCVQDTRAFRGADVDSDHGLMLSKLQLKFRKLKKHTPHPRFQPAPLHTWGLEASRAGMPPFSNPCQLHSHFITTSQSLTWSTARMPCTAPSCSPVMRSYANHPSPGLLGSHSPLCRSTNCGELGRPAKPRQRRPCTKQPTEPADRPQLQSTSSTGHHTWPRCRTARAKATSTQHLEASASSANPRLSSAEHFVASTQTGCCSHPKSA